MITLILYIVAFVLLALAAFIVPSRINLMAAGLAVWLAAQHLVPAM